MASLSRPMVYGSLVVIAAVAFWATSPQSAKAEKSAPPKSVREPLDQDWIFPEKDLAVRFDHPKGELRNVFKPLIESDSQQASSEEEEIMKLPAILADGEPDWAYTGMVEVDGKRLALLENASKHQGGYVREGELWKKSKIVRITMASIVLTGPDGTETTVNRFNANAVPKEKPPAEGGFRPLDVGAALKGPIGLQVTPTGAPAPNSAAPPRDTMRKFEEIKE